MSMVNPENPRLASWQQKLLDLSRRNPLLSMRLSRGLLLASPSPLALAQTLVNGVEGRVGHLSLSETGIEVLLGKSDAQPVPASDEEELTSETATKTGLRRVRRSEVSEQDLSALDGLPRSGKPLMLLDLATDEALQDELADLSRQARSRREEAGVNTLFFACGVLRWRDSLQGAWSDAPLFLLPVDLARANARTPFKLTLRDEEIVLNPAIAYLLEKQHGIDWAAVRTSLSGEIVDIQAAWFSVADAIAGLADFACLVDDGRLVLLSYAKHRMWQDLRDRSSTILAHPLIQRLLDPSIPRPEPPDMEAVAWEKLDQTHLPDSLLLPLAADASQLRAIVRVDRGEDLVIKGPPGTGKSQTIANIIAHSLGRGRRVLFVAEKMTALSVVHEKLNDLGLGAFCLELHASKSDKAGVLRQLREALDARLTPSVYGFAEAAASIHSQRAALNDGLEALHVSFPNGLTVYLAIGKLALMEQDEAASSTTLIFPDALTESAEAHPRRQRALRDLIAASASRPQQAAIFDCLSEYPPTDGSSFFEDMDLWASNSHLVQQLQNAWPPGFASATNPEGWGIAGLSDLASLWREFFQGEGSSESSALRLKAMDERVRMAWRSFEASDRVYSGLWSPFQATIRSSFLHEGQSLRQEWEKSQTAFFISRWLGRSKLSKKLALHHRQGQRPSPSEMDALFSAWPEIEQARVTAMEDTKNIRTLLGKLAPPAGQWGAFKNSCAWADRVFERIETERLKRVGPVLLEAMRKLLASEIQPPQGQDLFARLLQVLESQASLLARHGRQIILGVSGGVGIEIRSVADIPVSVIEGIIQGWRNARSSWVPWQAHERLAKSAQEFGLGALIEDIRTGRVPPSQAMILLDTEHLKSFINQAQMRHPELAAWQGQMRSRAIEDFVGKDAEFEELTRKHLVSKVAERLRDADLDRHPSMGVLRRELAKQRQHMPPRRLLRELSEIAPILKPCMMMSPLTVADVLGADTPPFDLVIFDEASQIPVADAVGALSHARQVIIVGDPKQMPPSRGFAGVVEEDDEEDITPKDLESILDECLVSMDHVVLNWHYRSRHEDLIAFSNSRYYKGELITFPPVDLPGHISARGIQVHDVPGIYDRGTSQTNMEEARQVVSAMASHLRSGTKETLGVITFNQRQQRLIERLWDRELRQDPLLEQAQSRLAQELVIKNLESVQGDERDVIYFSTTFGKDAGGRFLMNFGPLGQLGGERRLNVAITRARNRLEIFSSFLPEMIDVSAVKHRGIVDFRDYLVFARGGSVALAGVAIPTLGLPDSPFEIAVAKSLRDRGWDVHAQVGCSGYKIDLAIVDPAMPGRYLAGVECDGATYHSFKIARDRDRQRQRILEALGWKIERIWSTDWFSDPQREAERIDQALRQLKAG